MSVKSEDPPNGNQDKALRNVARAWLLRTNITPTLQQWVNFHHSPISLMHKSRWKDIGQTWLNHIARSSYACAYLDNYYRDHWNWEAGQWTDPKDSLMQLVVSSNQFLEQLATLAGALIASAEIRKTVDGKIVRLLRDSLGEQVLHFARVQVPQLDVTIPEAFRIQDWDVSRAAETVTNAGWLLITCASALLSTEEWRQFLRRVPQKTEDMWNKCNFSEEDFQMAWQCLQVLIGVMNKKE